MAVLGQTETEKITARATKIRSLECAFEQSKTSSVLVEAAKSEGMLYFLAPDKMLIEQTKPSKFALSFRANQAQIKMGEAPVQDLNASANRMLRELNRIVVGGINGTIFSDTKNYSIDFRTTNGITSATLVPKSAQMKRYISAIHISFDKEWLATQIETVESNGNKTTIKLHSKKTNTPIENQKFDLK